MGGLKLGEERKAPPACYIRLHEAAAGDEQHYAVCSGEQGRVASEDRLPFSPPHRLRTLQGCAWPRPSSPPARRPAPTYHGMLFGPLLYSGQLLLIAVDWQRRLARAECHGLRSRQEALLAVAAPPTTSPARRRARYFAELRALAEVEDREQEGGVKED